MSTEPILIIGGGPAGLSLAYELGQRGVRSRILEAGSAAGASWASMPRHLKLLSPWSQNVLFDRHTTLRERYTLKPAREYAAYLRCAVERFDLSIETGVKVRRVAPARDGFEVTSDRASWRAPVVVNATGYFAKPWTPRVPGLEKTRIPTQHFHAFRDAAASVEELGLRGRRALIVGKRVSGGQLVEELYAAGFSVAICCHTPLRFSRPPWLQTAVFPFYFRVEEMMAARNPFWLRDSNPPMQGGLVAKLVRSGRIETRPGIAEFGEETVRFADGSEEAFDVVFFATGFRPSLDHLEGLVDFDDAGLPQLRGMESAAVGGLYFLGLDNQRTFRSRYLRGIRDDARVLAEELHGKLSAVSR